MPLLSSRLDTLDRKLLYLFYLYGRALSRRKVHQLIYDLQSRYGVNLGFRFTGSPPFSQELDEKLESLVSRGYLKKLYLVGGSYTTLYKPFYAITERGAKVVEKRDFSKADQEAIEKLVEEYKRGSVKGAEVKGEEQAPPAR